MNIPRIHLPVPLLRRPSRRVIILIGITVAIFVIALAAWFYLLPYLGIIPKDLEMVGKTSALLTTHLDNTGTILSSPLAQPLVADFYTVLVNPDDPETLRFVDLSQGMADTWYWDFGDGANTTDRFPVHHFSSSAGNTTISLMVTSKEGAKSSISKNDLRAVVSVKPFKVLLDTNRMGIVMRGSSVSFRANGSSDSITVNNKPITLQQGSVVRLSLIKDSEGALAIRNGQLLGFSFPDTILFIDGKQAARGSVGQISIDNPAWLSTDLQFMVRPVNGDIRQFVVNRDVLQAGQRNAIIRIRHLDLYPLSDLTVETTPAYFDGDATGYNVLPNLIAEFEPSRPVTGVAPFNVTFLDRTVESPMSWSWDFGDGTVSTEKNPPHTYREPGSYTVSLTTRNSEITDTVVKERLVVVSSPRLQADFSALPVSGISPLRVRFTDQSTGSPTFWQWDFGDNSSGSVSSDRNPVHTYQTKGVYSVWLAVSNIFGSSDLLKKQYIVVSEPFRSPENRVFLRAGRGGYLEPGSTFQFVVTGSPATISSGGNEYALPVGTKVQMVVTTNQFGSIYVTGGKLVRFDLSDVALSINDEYIRTGRINSIYIPGFNQVQTSLSYYMPPDSVWTLYTENGYNVLTALENHWIRVSNIGVNENGLLSLIASENSTYLDGAAYQTVHDWIIE